jgi:ribose-phosphate pyrophosphokinase
MKILNLVDQSCSEIKYKISSFPDGQQDIQLLDAVSIHSSLNPKKDMVEIRSRFNSFKDLEIIICATKALRNLGVKEIHLYVPYVMGARSDRQFVEGGTSYLRDVIAPILNSLEFESVTCIDVHSDVAAACINRLKVVDNTQIVSSFISRVAANLDLAVSSFLESCVFVSPDAGSLKKIYTVAKNLQFTGEVLTCSKYRDTDGKLSKTHVPVRIDHYSKNLIIIDDICDGGRTFLNIAEEIKKTQPERTGKIYLVVSHGIFSAGFDELSKHLDGIYCSNSYSDIENSVVGQLDVF